MLKTGLSFDTKYNSLIFQNAALMEQKEIPEDPHQADGIGRVFLVKKCDCGRWRTF